MPMRLAAILAVVLMTGCAKSEPLGCGNDDQCPSGHVCVGSRCEQICAADAECIRGYVCTGGLCEQGSRTAPRIDTVFGNGSTSCPSAEAGLCFSDGLIIQGLNLLGASFRLESTTGGANFDLTLGSSQTDSQMTVMLPAALVADDYTLVAVNAAGAAQTGVNILQGEPSNMSGQAIVDRINGEATGSFDVGRMPAANSLITHLNTGSTKLDPSILPPASGGTNYTGNDIVDLINNDATTAIAATSLDTGDALMQRINGGSTALDAGLLPAGNDIISQINTGNGSLKISANVLPASSGGPATGNDVVTLLNDGGNTKIAFVRIPVGSSGTQVAAGNHTHTLATGNSLIAQINSASAIINEGRVTHPASGAGGGSYHMQRSTTGGALVPNATMDALCGDADGCTIQLGYRGGYGVPAILYGPPCQFHIDAGNNWAVAPWCLQRYEVNNGVPWAPLDPARKVNDDNTFGNKPYASYNYGVDNAISDCSGNGGCIVLEYFENVSACVLADASPTGTDNSDGFYFWMTGTFNALAGTQTCELKITD